MRLVWPSLTRPCYALAHETDLPCHGRFACPELPPRCRQHLQIRGYGHVSLQRTTAYSAPNEPFEYQFSLEPTTLDFIGVHSKIRLPAEISYFLNGQIAAEISSLVSFSVGDTVLGPGTGTHLIIPEDSPDFPAHFQGWFPGNPPLYSYTVSVEPTLEFVPTLYTGIFNVINENDSPFDGFFGATAGPWQISVAVVRVSLVPEASSLVSVALGSIAAISLWALRRRYRRT